jgi:hypothetical protein
MHIALKLALLVVAGTMLMTSTASAQTIEVVEEETNEHCPAVLDADTGGCLRHGVGEATLTGHVFGIEATASDCNVEFEGRADEDGEGYTFGASLTGDASHNCTRTPCNLPWRTHGEELTGSSATVTFEFCLRPSSGPDNVCLVNTTAVDLGNHVYETNLNDVPGTTHGGAACEYDIRLSGEIDATHPAVEVVHAP